MHLKYSLKTLYYLRDSIFCLIFLPFANVNNVKLPNNKTWLDVQIVHGLIQFDKLNNPTSPYFMLYDIDASVIETKMLTHIKIDYKNLTKQHPFSWQYWEVWNL